MGNDVSIGVYSERAALLGLLAAIYGGYLCHDPSAEEGFQTLVVLRLGEWRDEEGREYAWHVADDDIQFFPHLSYRPYQYDGHTTEEKYRAVRREIEFLNALNMGMFV